MAQEETKGIITVNVPGVSARYRFLLSAFVTVEKSVFTRMMKAVSEDTETAEENFRKILETLGENESKWKYGRGAFDRVKVAKSFFQEKETPQQKRFNKAVQAFCAGKKDPRPALRLPFMRNDGKLYATNAYIALRIETPALYTGEKSEEGVAVEKCFPADFKTGEKVILPDEKTLKSWVKTGKTYKTEALFTTSALWGRLHVFPVSDLLALETATGSRVMYVYNDFGIIEYNGITALALSRKQEEPETLRAFEKACIFVKGSGQDIFMGLSENQPAEEPEEVKPEEVKPAEPLKEEPEEVKPAEVKEETQEAPETVNPAPLSVADLSRMVSNEYSRLYESRDSVITREESREYQNRFDGNMTDYEKRVLSALVAYRNDFISSDREVNAFFMALDSISEKGLTLLLPEEPEKPGPAEEPETTEAMKEPEEPETVETEEEPEAAELFTIKYNSQFGSTDISFKEKPSAEVIQALKKMRFRWHKMKRLWYGYKSPEVLREAVLSAYNPAEVKPEEVKPAEVKPAEKKPASIPDKYKTYYETIFNALRECHENPKDPGRVAYYNGLLSAGSMFLPPETLSSFPRFS